MEGKELQGKILVIDDERGPRESLRMVLKYDYEVFLAERVDAGIELLRDIKPDLVIMDIRMPEKNGIEGLQETGDVPDSGVGAIIGTGNEIDGGEQRRSLSAAQEGIPNVELNGFTIPVPESSRGIGHLVLGFSPVEETFDR